MKPINSSLIIDTKALFWGNELLNNLVTEKEREQLVNKELVSWLSFIYWGEDLAMKYAKVMANKSSNKERWEKIYQEEFKHKTLVSNYLLERELVPDEMNTFVEKAHLEISQIAKDIDLANTTDLIKSIQIFLEEALFITIKYRLPFIKDRDLKSILYIILLDEANHISHGKKEILAVDGEKIKFGDEVLKRKELLFPLSLSKNILSSDTTSLVKENISRIVQDVIQVSLNKSNHNFPIPILKEFKKIPEYNCIACCPTRADGLHLEPILTGDIVTDDFIFPQRCEGFDSIVHGGFVAMVLDEMACYAPILKSKKLPMTMSLEVKYQRPVETNKEYRIQAEIKSREGQVFTVFSSISDNQGILASSIATLYIPSAKKAKSILGSMANSPIVKELLYDS